MRLIDADALIQKRNHAKVYAQDMYAIGQGYVMDAPEVDAAPVVRGEWKMDTDPDDGDCRCSSCKVCIDALHRKNHGLLNALGHKLHTFYKYCPNCGAKMEDKPCG